MGKQRPCREKQGRNVKVIPIVQISSGFYGGMVDRLSSKIDEEV